MGKDLGIPTIINRASTALDHAGNGAHIAALNDLAFAQRALDAALAHQVRILRGDGHTWAVIGHQLGVSKQAAQKKYAESKTVALIEDSPLPFDDCADDDAADVAPVPVDHPGDWTIMGGVLIRCENCQSRDFPKVPYTDWCSRCHGADDPSRYRAGGAHAESRSVQ